MTTILTAPRPTLAPDTAPATTAPELDRLRVLVADDHPLYRAGIVRALESSEAFDVVAETGDGREALTLIRTLAPDVALLDVRMPGMDGIDVVAALARDAAHVPVVLLSAFDDEPLIRAGLDAGAAAYLVKSADRAEICLEVAAAARAARSPTALHGPADLRPSRLPHWSPRLTVAQHRLLVLAADGRSRTEMSDVLGLDEPMLRRLIDAVLARLGTDTLGEAVDAARAQGIVR